MTDPLTDAYLDAIEQRANAATEGPWRAAVVARFVDDDGYLGRLMTAIYPAGPSGPPPLFVTPDWLAADAEFIAHARSDVPVLVAEVRRLRAMEQRVREYARHLARPFAPSVRTCRKFRQVDGVPDREGEQIASELLVALDGGE